MLVGVRNRDSIVSAQVVIEFLPFLVTGSTVSVLCARILFCTKSCLKKNNSHKFFFPNSGLTSNSLLLNQSSFNSSVPLSLEHQLIISVIMLATPKVPPLHHNRT